MKRDGGSRHAPCDAISEEGRGHRDQREGELNSGVGTLAEHQDEISAALGGGTGEEVSQMHIQTMARYNRWMNQKVYECCSGLSDEKRKRDMGAFFKSIHGTLNHLLLTDRVWMGRFTGKPFHITSLDHELYSDFDVLRSEREAEDSRIIEWVASLSPHDMDEDLIYTSIVNPEPRRYPLWFALSHFFNHQTHHRGQATTLLTQLGIDVGVTDLIGLPSDET